jgi:nitroreductase
MNSHHSISPLDALRWRYATKQFDPSKLIPDEPWQALMESLVLTPSSFGLQPWKFIVVGNPSIRESLKNESWNQSQVTDASHFVVMTARTDIDDEDINAWIKQLASTQAKPTGDFDPLKSMIQGFVANMDQPTRRAWNTKQVYIALGQLMTSAAMMGIDTCPMEGISSVAYDRILGLADSGYATVVACALGYRSAEDPYAQLAKARFPIERVIERMD